MRFLFNTFFFEPLYNALVWLTDLVPGGEIGWAVIILTVLVKAALFPLQHRVSRTQVKLREVDTQIKAIRNDHKADPQKQAALTMALYREHGINPFAGFLLLLIQIPLLLALFWVFRGGFDFKPELLYSFVQMPDELNAVFLGLIDLTKRSLPLAVLAGITQYFQITLAMPPQAKVPAKPGSAPSFKNDLAHNMQKQMRYTFPVLVVVFSWGLPAAVPLYWLVSNLISLAHEWSVRRQAKILLSAPNATN
jgi:YidC/Oxa1 family membrane protein insertase